MFTCVTDSPAGFECPQTNSSTVTPCVAGVSFSLGGQPACTPWSVNSWSLFPCFPACYDIVRVLLSPVGFVCPSVDGSGNRKCLPGTFVAGTLCASCTAGYECADGISRSACPVGRYSASGAASCTVCPAGYACANPADPSAVTACPTGSYSIAGSSACSQCPAGFTCLSQATDQISPCSPGRYSPLGTMFCLDCSPGSSCADPAAGPQPCPSGQYSAVNSVNCTSCPPGFQCPTPDVNPVRCAVGRFSSGDATSCSPCTPGYRYSHSFSSSYLGRRCSGYYFVWLCVPRNAGVLQAAVRQPHPALSVPWAGIAILPAH
jgi:hypothetical protein